MAHRKHTSWKEKRKSRMDYDQKKKAKADAERFRRLKHAAIKKANEIFEDGHEVGQERRVYLCIWECGRDNNVHGKYIEYISHPDTSFPPSRSHLASSHTVTKIWTPQDFTREGSVSRPPPSHQEKPFRISKPPRWQD